MRAAEIIEEVLKPTEFTKDDLPLRSNFRPFAWARAEICYRLHTETDFSLSKIGRIAGGVDHTTVLNAIKKFPSGMPPYKRETSFNTGRNKFLDKRYALLGYRFKKNEAVVKTVVKVQPKPETQPSFRSSRDRVARATINRVGAVNLQIKQAERYGQNKKAEELRERRQLIIDGVLA